MSLKHIFVKKNLEMLRAETDGEHRLHRVLGPISLTALGIGCIIGAGIFVLTGVTAAYVAGPSIIASFCVAAVACTLAALCYAEFASMAPVAGSAYTYAYTTLGEIFAWIIGWDLILEYAMGCATVAAAWGKYLNELLAMLGLWRVPPQWSYDPFTYVESMGGYAWFNLPAVIVMAVVTIILVVGIQGSARVNSLLVVIKVSVVIFIIAMGIFFVRPENWTSIPVTQRLLPQERVIPELAKNYYHATEAAPGATKAENTEKINNLANGLRATYHREWAQEEAKRLQEAGRLNREGADQMIAAVDADTAANMPKSAAERAAVQKLLPDVRIKGGAEATATWGLLGVLGLNRWLVPIDDAFRSRFAPYGLSGIMLGAALVFFAFIGFDSISTQAEEARKPDRDVPLSILASLIICTVLYIAVTAVITGMVPYPQIDINAPIAVAFAKEAEAHQSWLLRLSTALIAVGGLAGMTSVILVFFLSQARVFMAMARDGLLPKVFGKIHPKFRTPYIATIMTGTVIALVAAVTPIDKLVEMVNVGTLMAFGIVCAAVLVLRIQRPDVRRPFKCPMLWLVAPLGVAINIGLMLFLSVPTWLRLAIWMGAGLAIYFGYSRRHSHLFKNLMHEIQTPYNEAVEAANDIEPDTSS